MRAISTIALGAAACGLAAFSAPAARADWCGTESKGITNCGYASAEQCRIGLNGAGNCFQNTPAPAPADAFARTRTRKPAR